MKTTLPIMIVSLATFAMCYAAAEDEAPKPAPPDNPPAKVELNDLEKKFEKTLTGATLIGRSSFQGNEDQAPAEDRYEISKVTKLKDDLWLFTARIGKAKIPVPLPVPVKWAGDTPVISVTKLKVPTMGTYTARVVIYDDHYAGTWDAGDHAGYIWGRIEREGEAKEEGEKVAN